MILAIDTAGVPSQVVFLSKNKQDVLAEKTWHQKHSQSEKTLKYIKELIDSNSFSLSDIDQIYINIGPSHFANGNTNNASFTGLKIGVTIANGLSFALNIPVVGVSLDNRSFLETIKSSDKVSTDRFVVPNYPKPPNINKKSL